MKKVNRCPHGGLRQVRTLLIKGEEITCAACQALFKKHNFEQERMEEVIAAVINGELIPKIKDEKKQSENPQIEDNQDEEKGEDQPDGEKGEARKKGSKAVEARRRQRVARLSEREQCMDYLHQYQGIIELLPTGSQGKRIPFRCLLCKTRSQPHGKVGELSAWKLSTVEYFLDKHLSCDTHQKNMRKAKNKGSEVVEKHLVPCEAVAINDEATSGKLFYYQTEFELWASVANFDDNASHTYFTAGNVWHVRAENCEKETVFCEDMERQVCGACLNLGSPKSVSWKTLVMHGYAFESVSYHFVENVL